MELTVIDLPERMPQWEAFVAERNVPDFRQHFMPASDNAQVESPEKDGKETPRIPSP